jgi:ComF family protein
VPGPSLVSDIGESPAGKSWTGKFSLGLAESLFAVLFPSDCRICGEPLARVSRLPVCLECLHTMRPIAGGLCSTCGERLFSPYALSSESGSEGRRCGLCQRIDPAFVRAVAYGSYEGGLRELIHLLKYSGVRPAADVLGRMLAEAIASLEAQFSAAEVLAVPVPMFRARFRGREFNHAELIARSAVKVRSLSGRLRLCPDLLLRKRETPSQTGLTRHQRRQNVRGAFGVTQAEKVRDREVLLVDDVFTTGATVSECARVLRRAGATKVWVATVARTLKASEPHVEIRLPEEEGDDVFDVSAVREGPLARAVAI